MIRKIFVTLPVTSILFLACTMQPNASLVQHDSSLNLEEQVSSNEQLILLYLSCGNVNLLSQNYSSAFDDYQRALDALTNSSSNGLEFLILFGMVIACDNLHLTDLCKFNILRINALINSAEEDGVTEYLTTEDDEVTSYLKALANMSPSIEIRDTLQFYISEIFPSSPASYSLSANYMNPALFSYEGQCMIYPCKSFWKRLEKLGRNIRRGCEKVLDIIERALDIKDRVEGKPQQKLRDC